jgi:DnaJ domain
MENPTEAFPLTWPAGWKREHGKNRARFSKQTRQYGNEGQSWSRKSELSIADGTQRVLKVLEQMGYNTSVVISSNLQLRNDGLPRSNQSAPADPGVAVYWGRGAKARCIAVDQYDRVADNLAAIAATLEAMRAIERHGGAAILDRAFTGFKALAAPEQPWQVLGVKHDASDDEIETAYRRLASDHHPDRGGDPQKMARINAARDAALNR